MRERILVFLALLLWPGVLPAQLYPRYELYLNGGVSEPFFPKHLAENWRWGFNGGIGLGYRLSPKLILDGSIDFNSFRFDDVDYYSRLGESGYITTVDGKLSWVGSLTGALKYFIDLSSEEDTFLFLTGGAGLQRIHIGSIRTEYQNLEVGLVREESSASMTDFGFQIHAGAGLDLVASHNRSYYVEVRYVVGFLGDYNSHFLPVKVGIRQVIR